MGFAPSGIHAGRMPNIVPSMSAEDLDEVGGLGDELDHASLRDIAVLRFLRHREWMEAAAGAGAVALEDIQAPQMIPTTLESDKQVREMIEAAQTEISELERELQTLHCSDDKSKFLRDSISKLRDEFGTSASKDDSEKTLQSIYNELQDKFQLSVVEKKRVTAVKPELDLPEYASACAVHEGLGSTGFQLGQIQDPSSLGHEFVNVDDPDSVLGDVLSLPGDL